MRGVEWHDLRSLTPKQRVWELTVSVPWLVGSLVAFDQGWSALGLVGAFFFFLTALRQAHGAQHYHLGIGKFPQDCLLLILSALMVTSLHALQATHLHHHRHCLEASDVEAHTAGMPWWRAVLSGPWFILMLNLRGRAMSRPSKLRWIHAEWALAIVFASTSLLIGPASLRWFVGAMIVGECLTGFFAVWTVHHGCEPEHILARTQRGWLKNFISYDMFFHLEHHLFPAVPTPRLPELAARLDDALPELRVRQVF